MRAILPIFVLLIPLLCVRVFAEDLRVLEPSTSLPLVLYDVPVGTARALVFDVPADALATAEVRLELTIDDIDSSEEGSLTLNGRLRLSWPSSLLGEGLHSGSIPIPRESLRAGRNSFRFTFDSTLSDATRGYIVQSASLRFDFLDRAARVRLLASQGGDYRKAVLSTPGLVAYYPLDSLDGNSTLNLVSNLDANARDCRPLDEGLLGGALAFDGLHSVLSVAGPDLASLLNSAPGVTVELWVAPGHDLDLPQTVMTLRGCENYGSQLQLSGLTLNAFVRSAKEAIPPAVGALAPGRFSHVVLGADFEKGILLFSVNGSISRTPRAFSASTAQYTGTTVPTTFGAGNTALDRPFAGSLDEIAVYRTALDDDTIRAHYELLRARAESLPAEPIPPRVEQLPPDSRLTFAPITSFCDWVHSYHVPFTPDGIQTIVDRHVAAGVKRIVWRCTDGGTTAYWSKLREPFHGLLPDNCHVDYFLTPNLAKFEKSDFRTLDSFAEVITRAHAARIEVYAWVQVSGEDDAWGYASKRVREHPEVCTVGRNGNRFRAKLAWALPENQEYLLGLLREILAYQPDGIILDFVKNQGDYRDQLTDDAGVVLHGYEPEAVEAFKSRTGKDPFSIPNDDPDWIAFRAGFVTDFCRKARALQRAQAPNVRWIGQIWGGGGTNRFIKLPEPDAAGRKYRIEEHPVRDALAGQLCDIAAWSKEDLFDSVFPLASPSGDPAAFRLHMRSTADLLAQGKTRLAAGAYVWGTPRAVFELARIAAEEFHADEFYLAESLAYEPDGWSYLKLAVRLCGK
ncbi:MAG: LamG-like jellyroll fold domain-containing protein [Planctomycetota bacterium]